jgi:AcrR family transcriptional regulator
MASRTYVQRGRAANAQVTRDRILDAAIRLIPEAGASLPVAAIARDAGVAVQTIYDQFGSKGGLLIATVNRIQESAGLLASLTLVFESPHGEEAMRRMIAATVGFWHRAWPYLEFMLRARRVDPVVEREMAFVDRLRRAHFWAITQQLAHEGRIRDGRSPDWAAEQAFALTTPTVYEEIGPRGGGSVESAIETCTQAVLSVIVDPDSMPAADAFPNWQAHEEAAAARAMAAGSDPSRLSPEWQTARAIKPAAGPRPRTGRSRG